MRSIDLLELLIKFSQEKKDQGLTLDKVSMETNMVVYKNELETVVYSFDEVINYFREQKLKRIMK